LSKKGEANPTHNGAVATNTVELVIDVYSNELVHVAKCSPSSKPDIDANPHLLCPISPNSSRRPASVKGSSIIVDSIKRQKAITSEGTDSFCARRIRIEPDEIAKIPTVSTAYCTVREGFLNESNIVKDYTIGNNMISSGRSPDCATLHH
jgi:hypothetical protein